MCHACACACVYVHVYIHDSVLRNKLHQKLLLSVELVGSQGRGHAPLLTQLLQHKIWLWKTKLGLNRLNRLNGQHSSRKDAQSRDGAKESRFGSGGRDGGMVEGGEDRGSEGGDEGEGGGEGGEGGTCEGCG